METKHVPAEGWGRVGEKAALYVRLLVSHDTTPPQGHQPNRHVLFDHWSEVRWILANVLHGNPAMCRGGDKWKRVEMVLEALRLQATRGKCYASAKYFGGVGFASEKTWDRTIAWLRSHFLVSTERLYREDGTQSTNLADFSSLWALILAVLQDRGVTFERLADGMWLKLNGLWKHLEDFLKEVLSFSLPPPLIPLRSPWRGRRVDDGQQQPRTY